jgi:hypothetical protein
MVEWLNGGTQWTPASQIVGRSDNPRIAGHCLMGSFLAIVGGVIASLLFGLPPKPRDPC